MPAQGLPAALAPFVVTFTGDGAASKGAREVRAPHLKRCVLRRQTQVASVSLSPARPRRCSSCCRTRTLSHTSYRRCRCATRSCACGRVHDAHCWARFLWLALPLVGTASGWHCSLVLGHARGVMPLSSVAGPKRSIPTYGRVHKASTQLCGTARYWSTHLSRVQTAVVLARCGPGGVTLFNRCVVCSVFFDRST